MKPYYAGGHKTDTFLGNYKKFDLYTTRDGSIAVRYGDTGIHELVLDRKTIEDRLTFSLEIARRRCIPFEIFERALALAESENDPSISPNARVA